MKLYILRHGYAGDADDTTEPDRELTDEGRVDVERIAAWMMDNGEVPSLVFSGPRLRTQQTAEVLRSEIGLPKATILDGLGPERGNALAQTILQLVKDPTLKKIAVVSDHDAIQKGLAFLVGMTEKEYDTIAMGELRILKIDREDGYWREKLRILPSDLGGENRY